jgi:aminoglycoside phosphotransferase (APT) family kinase protein
MQPSELKALALRYVPGTGAPLIEPLGAGLVNETYRVRRDDRAYSLRVAGSGAQDLAPDRGWECQLLARAAEAGIGPVIECCEPGAAIVVARWTEGAVWSAREVRCPENLQRFAELARRIHALAAPPGGRVMNPAAWIAHYEAALARHGRGAGPAVLGLRAAAAGRIRELGERPPPAPVLCHSDLHTQNLILSAHGPVLLDWEYAHLAEPFWDLAGWAGNNDLEPACRHALLGDYLGRQAGAVESARLDALVWLYDYVCLLWSELYLGLRAHAREGVRARARLLAERLR